MSEFAPLPEQSEDVPGRPAAWTLLVTVLAIATCAVVVWALDAFQLAGGGRSDTVRLELVPPARPFTASPPSDRVRQSARDDLERWSWADRPAGRVRLPVSIAIERYLKTRGTR
jgi:hypothetical protein